MLGVIEEEGQDRCVMVGQELGLEMLRCAKALDALPEVFCYAVQERAGGGSGPGVSVNASMLLALVPS